MSDPFWLIERPHWIGGRPHWWHPRKGWVLDVNDAIQFARRQDAEDIRKAACTDNEVVTEHRWMGTLRTTLPTSESTS